ncbi:hypothetical protein [Corallococcus sp. 4LFB]|uniref:hypothetical protein n=1 Tax=Corallococcus sp. 4LFB TaxID=3383249 RepID=UPI003975F262
MARTKAFDRDEAVRRAMQVFCEQGYEATSTDDLLRAMGMTPSGTSTASTWRRCAPIRRSTAPT